MDLQMKLCDSVTGSLNRTPSFNLKMFRKSVDESNSEESRKIRRHTPVGSGEYSVGCWDMMCGGPTEKGSFFRLFYPVEKTDIYKRDKQWPLWLPRKQYGEGYADILTKNPKIKVVGKLLNWMGGDVYVPALWQGPLCPSNTQFPVVIFSHGLGGNRTTNTTVCCELASQGFIVASLEHRDGSASMTYHLTEQVNKHNVTTSGESNTRPHHRPAVHRTHLYSEEWKPFEWFEPWDDFTYRNKQVHHRADEVIRALETLILLHNGKEVHNIMRTHFNTKQFMNRLDLSRVVVMGHSFGGATTLCTLSKDKRFRLGVVLDGWMHPLDERVYEDTQQPVLMINMESFQWKTNVEQMMRLLSQDKENRRMITIKGTCHQSVTDFQFLVNKTVGRVLDVRHRLSPKVAMSLTNKASLGFIRKHLGLKSKDTHEDLLCGDHDHIIVGTNVDLS